MKRIYRCNISILFVLFACAGDGQKKDNDPRNADFSPHLQVDRSKTGVEASTHKIVVEKVSGHANLGTGEDSIKVGDKGDTEPINH